MFLPLLKEAWISIGTNRMRMFLAMLGIVIGVGSVVLMLAIGSGSKRAVEDAIHSLGSNLLIVNPAGGGNTMRHSRANSNLNIKDAEAIGQLSTVAGAAPTTDQRHFTIERGQFKRATQVMGTSHSYFAIRNWPIAEGDSFSDDDVQLGNRMVVLGMTVYKQLFLDEQGQGISPVGSVVHINGSDFHVSGVLAPKGIGFDGSDQDDAVFIPIIAAQTHLWSQYEASRIVQTILVQAGSAQLIDVATEDVMNLLRQRHQLGDAEENTFMIRSLASLTQTATDTTQAMSILLGAISSISLVVGGIGIMNIMLVTVTERTREIGIRKAIGATESNILLQFLLEAVMISIVGSLIGLVIGVGGGLAAQRWFGVRVEYSIWSVLLALGVAFGIGVASGLYPAYKGAKLQPIEALRSLGI
jgi:putative ABC transport system permease protein